MKLRILLLILVLPALLFVCALLLTWTPLPYPFPPPFSGARDRMAAIATGILGAGYLIGLTVYVMASFVRAGRALDPVLTSAGLVPEGYLAFGRRYRGVIQGREVQVTFLPSQGVSAAQLNVYVSASLGTRVAIARGKPLLDCGDCPRVKLDEAPLGGFQVYSRDGEYVRSLLDDSEVRDALERLLDDGDVVGSREMYLQPERVWLRARPRGLTEGLFRQWLDDLIALARAGEKVLEHRSAEDSDFQY
jgi:hypothetical protein